MEPSESNTSHQELMSDSDSGVDIATMGSKTQKSSNKITLGDIPLRDWFTICILCYVNLINYMDRFTIAGILTDIQSYFHIQNDDVGLIQTAFVISYMIFAPIFGYLGDRYSRRWIMAIGVILWSLTTLVGSFMQDFRFFMLFRAMVGIGEASYSTIAPTIISDMYVHSVRSKMLALFYFAIPVGSGLGYIVGSETARLAGQWQYALRVTPVLGITAAVLIIFVLKEPERGESEGASELRVTSWFTDIKALCKNRTFVFSSAGFTCVAFVAGALSWWGPLYIHMGLTLQPGNEDLTINDVSFKFGIISMLAGLLGVPTGAAIAQRLRLTRQGCDPLVCGWSLIFSAPMVFLALITISASSFFSYIFIFIAQFTLNFTWSIVADILLYVVISTRRSTAEAFQILVSHAFGDAGSPYLIGVVSEAIKHVGTSSNSTISREDKLDEFHALQYALFITAFVEVLGGIFFLLSAIYIIRDKEEVERATNTNRMYLCVNQNQVNTSIQQPTHLYAEDVSDTEQRHNLVS
ncbi:protein spinster isoform X2 [Chrysoperla carnea]|uniref:protein spinster isoform X2 n=1 Tax=Chrysoperla carnea TaxID=189513 RepID=UPI001D065569|nr:protein spinster isoform X2 [Chrysoperla carnea]